MIDFIFRTLAILAISSMFAVSAAASGTDAVSGACTQPSALQPKLGSTSDCGPDPTPEETSADHAQKEKGVLPFTVVLFWGDGCPHCAVEKNFLANIVGQFPAMKVQSYEVWYDRTNADTLNRLAQTYKMKSSGVPVTFIGNRYWIGFSDGIKSEILSAMKKCSLKGCSNPLNRLKDLPIEPAKPAKTDDMTRPPQNGQQPAAVVAQSTAGVGTNAAQEDDCECRRKDRLVEIPLIGKLDVHETSLPLMTLVIAGLDSFNPCAFFVLFALLGLLVHARSRPRMLFIGAIFVFFSGFIYFIFMAAWLNLFLVMGQVALITTVAGVIALIMAVINIKDFFVFKSGVSLTIPDSAKPKLFDRMRRLMRSTSVVSMLVGSAVLAIAANSYELLCTAGFPMVFTRILTLNNLPLSTYYAYLALYNIIYVIPLATIVILFTYTLGKRQLTERQGRLMKLLSGTMMLGLSGVLLAKPALLNNVLASAGLLIGAAVVSLLFIIIERRIHAEQK